MLKLAVDLKKKKKKNVITSQFAWEVFRRESKTADIVFFDRFLAYFLFEETNLASVSAYLIEETLRNINDEKKLRRLCSYGVEYVWRLGSIVRRVERDIGVTDESKALM